MIRVLVVEDEPVAADAHRAYVERTPGFSAVAVAGTGVHAVYDGHCALFDSETNELVPLGGL